MSARRLIEQQEFFEPEQLVAVTRAFEKAWAALQAGYVNDADRETARLRLANHIIDLAKQGIAGEEHLIELAIEAMSSPLH